MKWFSLLLALLIGLILGFLIAPDSESSSVPGLTEESTTASGASGGKGSSGADATAAEFVEGELSASDQVKAAAPITKEWLKTLEGMNSFDQIGALHARLRHVPDSEFPELMDELGLSRGDPLSWQTQSMIAARWAEADPAGLKAYIETQPRQMSWGLNNALYAAWGKKDMAAALASANELSHNERRNAIGAIAASIAEKSPKKALQIMQEQLQFDNSGQWMYQNMFRAWARRDPDGALAAAYELEDGRARSSALVGAMSDLIRNDPRAAVDWLDSQDQDQFIRQTRQSVLNQILQEDVNVVLDYVSSREDPFAVKQALESVHFSQLAWQQDYEAIEGVMDWLGTVATGQTYTNKVADIMRAMTDSDPDRAAEFALQLSPGATRTQSLSAVASTLIQSDVDAAMSFVAGLEFDDEKRRALSSMSWQLAQYHTEKAKQLMLESEDPVVQQSLANTLAQQLMQNDRDGTLEWASQIQDDQARDNVVRSVLSTWVVADPTAAFDHIASMEEGTDKVNYYQNTIQTYLYEDPASAVKWLSYLDDQEVLGNQTQSAYQQAANAYVRFDPMAASEWISTLESGENRDGAVDSLVRQIYQSDPEAGFQWATTVDDENRRRNGLDLSVRSWAKDDPAAAQKAVEDATIEAEEKERLLGLIESASK